jgi:2-polyprenyl-6-methoxyphenol hydroxylase-like FAD-dependent oxidoreductase
MDIPKRCDVVVIGGGPGGSTAATLLSQKGYDVVLQGADERVEADGFVQKRAAPWPGTASSASFGFATSATRGLPFMSSATCSTRFSSTTPETRGRGTHVRTDGRTAATQERSPAGSPSTRAARAR